MMKKSVFLTVLLACLALFPSCSGKQEPYSVRMVKSEMLRNPDALHLDGRQGERKWNYTTGLELLSFVDVAQRYGLGDVMQYVKDWADTMTTPDGNVYGYKRSAYNVDHICPARLFFDLDDFYGVPLPENSGTSRYIRTRYGWTVSIWHCLSMPNTQRDSLRRARRIHFSLTLPTSS